MKEKKQFTPHLEKLSLERKEKREFENLFCAFVSNKQIHFDVGKIW